jgi:hypothetical protein
MAVGMLQSVLQCRPLPKKYPYIIIIIMSQDRLVVIATSYGLDDRGVEFESL